MITFLRALSITVAGLASLLVLGGRAPAWDGVLVPGAVMTQPFGCTAFELEPIDASCPQGHFHGGIDFAAPAGTQVHAPAPGVAHTGAGGPCGIHVVVEHEAGMLTLYCHLAAAFVADREPVTPGQVIGLVGSSGLSTGSHLHFEVHRSGLAVDPAPWLISWQAGNNKGGT